jgi:hypothetical protein
MLKVREETQPPDAEVHYMLTDIGFTGPHYMKVGIEYHHPSGNIIFHLRRFEGWEHWDHDRLIASEHATPGCDVKAGLKNHIGKLDLKE